MQTSFTSCKKENEANPKTKAELLTSKTWKYIEYYRNNGTLVYKRGNASNLINLDQNRVTFYANGTYSELSEAGIVYPGTWHFTNNETQVQVDNATGTYVSTINTLSESSYNWSDPITAGGTVGKMIPQ